MADKIKVLNQEGKEVEEILLNPELFNSRVNQRLLHLVITAYAGNKRRGLADTKTRREVRGGGKKPWKQKGTGNARQGSIRAPQWRGGGTVFGPTPRSFRTELPEQMKKRALVSALSKKNSEKQICVVKNIKLNKPKTKELCQIIKNLGREKTKSLYLSSQADKNLELASRNIHEKFKIMSANDVSAYDVLRRKNLIIEKEALGILERRALRKGVTRQ